MQESAGISFYAIALLEVLASWAKNIKKVNVAALVPLPMEETYIIGRNWKVG